jgi:hypothetical protein
MMITICRICLMKLSMRSVPNALAERSVDRLEQNIHAWRLTSDLLRDTAAMARVNADIDRVDVDVPSPEGMLDESAE